jgi:hypothetical protein
MHGAKLVAVFEWQVARRGGLFFSKKRNASLEVGTSRWFGRNWGFDLHCPLFFKKNETHYPKSARRGGLFFKKKRNALLEVGTSRRFGRNWGFDLHCPLFFKKNETHRSKSARRGGLFSKKNYPP